MEQDFIKIRGARAHPAKSRLQRDNGASNFIKIRGARTHNLKNVNVDVPRNKLVVITGISGSGKSSLAFDTLYAEGQRRYVESLSAYARQFLGVMKKPDVDRIEGISPAISIDQRKTSHNPRSTVGTITEIYDYLRLLFARIGKPHCPKCGKIVSCQTIDQIVEQIVGPENFSEKDITILGPVIRGRKGEHRGILEEIQRTGFVRVRIDGILYRIEEALETTLDPKKKHNIEVVVDRLVLPARIATQSVAGGDKDLEKSRLVDSLETALKLGRGIVIVNKSLSNQVIKSPRKSLNHLTTQSLNDLTFSEYFACEECGFSLPEIEPRLFSFNSPYGACSACTGLGEKLEVDPKLVIPNHNLSIAEGAIFPWARASHKVGRQSFFWWQLSQLSEEYSFSLNEPIRNLPKKILNIILYGNGRFEGVIPNLERRHHQTDSDYTRDEIEKYMVGKQCEKCQGKRLKPEVLAVTITGKSIDDIVSMSIDKAKDFFKKLSRIKSESRANKSKYSYKFASNSFKLASSESKIAHPVVKEILNRLQFLIDVGLDYLALKRKAETLAGGEEQRIKLATQIGSKLTGVLYILDEPSVGLHFRDQKRLIETLKKLRDLGNTLVVVEHDPQTIKAADWVIDIGPGAGKHGGRVIFEGTPKELLKAKTLTGEYLSGKKRVEITRQISKSPGLSEARNSPEGCFLISKQIPWTRSELPEGLHSKSQIQNYLIIKGAKEHNLKNIDVKIPLGLFVCITGVSGSGKSSLMQDILCRALMRKFYNSKEEPGAHETILGWERLDKVVLVDQSPIGRTPRSNPATYTGAFSYIRTLFARTREARIRGYQSGRFSFNVKGGRCEACQGQGQNKIEMYFLPDVYVECQECDGKRYNKEALEIEVKGKNIAQVLEMTTEEALDFFKNIPGLFQKLKTLNEVGLGYIQLGQPAPSLSGGEAQRVKLSAELSKKGTGRTLYILDEPTTGLHFDDIKKLLRVLGALVDRGNTVVVIEHQIDLVKNADWIIDLGPEGGEKGGYIVAEGTPLEISKNKKSYTGRYLKLYLAPH